MNNVKISVIIPVYNLEDRLGATLESLINQTHENLEIILVDDGSSDGSLSVMRAYAERDGRIKIISKQNGGVSSARNAGLDAASGEYVGFIDGDDVVEPDMYEYLLSGAIRYSADLVQCGVLKDGQAVCTPKRDVIIRDKSPFSARNIDKLLAGGVWCKLYRKECIKDIRFDERFPIGEDLYYTLNAFKRTKCIAFLSEAKYSYITRSGSALNSARSEEKLTSYRKMLKEAMPLLLDSRDALGYLKRELLRNDADMCSRIIRSGSRDFDALYEEIRKEVRENIWTVLFSRGLEPKMRIKLLLLAYLDRLYRRGVMKAHEQA